MRGSNKRNTGNLRAQREIAWSVDSETLCNNQRGSLQVNDRMYNINQQKKETRKERKKERNKEKKKETERRRTNKRTRDNGK